MKIRHPRVLHLEVIQFPQQGQGGIGAVAGQCDTGLYQHQGHPFRCRQGTGGQVSEQALGGVGIAGLEQQAGRLGAVANGLESFRRGRGGQVALRGGPVLPHLYQLRGFLGQAILGTGGFGYRRGAGRQQADEQGQQQGTGGKCKGFWHGVGGW